MQPREDLLSKLDAFDPRVRQAALTALTDAVQAPAAGTNVNLHIHSFFSYNAQGYSPSRIVWEARCAGLYAAGLCDFDVLDGLEEFIEAGLTVGLRTTVNLETRAYLKEYAAAEINSPGEPGVTYIMGGGFTRVPAAGTAAAATLQALRTQAAQRNEALILRINPHLGPAAIDFARDVVPLSPGGCPTERHIVRAYANRVRGLHARPEDQAAFWTGLLGKPAAELLTLMANVPAFEERIRARLVKQGGLGYVPPTEETFPGVDAFVRWVLDCEAVPMVTWLDGTSAGERDPAAMLACLQAKGCAAVNIIPDRNWNLADPAARAVKQANLKAFVEAAARLHLPINIGTEMNRDGLPFTDDLDGAALKPYRELFLDGARVMVGHAVLARYADYSYVGAGARRDFGTDAAARNRFFAAVGGLPPLTRAVAERLTAAGPAGALAAIRQAVATGAW